MAEPLHEQDERGDLLHLGYDAHMIVVCKLLLTKTSSPPAAAKITTQETSKLGSSSNYMQKLLKLVQRRTVERSVDVTLKFTLSALWNLTDESPETCSVFLQVSVDERTQLVCTRYVPSVQAATSFLSLGGRPGTLLGGAKRFSWG